MGQERTSTLHAGRERVAGKALLESDHLLFRGDGARVKVLFAGITEARAADGVLTLVHAGGTTELELGPAAATWLEKIRNPRSLLDKLGVKAGMRVVVIAVSDEDFLAQLAERTTNVSRGRVRSRSDVIIFGAESKRALEKLATLRRSLAPAGAIWVVHRKGKEAALKDVEVFAAARAAGLVDVKMASFSATHTAEKLVIPLANR